jgi:DNA-binding transcriptional MocR family regulator
MPEAAKRRLVRMLAARDIPLIEDCIYSDLGFGARQASAAKAYDRNGTVMLCSSFSKTFAPGLRIGWALAGRHAARVQMLKFVSSVGVSELFQLAAAEFLAGGGYDRLLRKLRRTYAQQIETMTHAVSRHFPKGTRVARPGGGFVLWVAMPEGVDSVALYEAALKEGIGLAPGPMFSASGRYRNCLRFNCGLPWSAQLERAVARLGVLAREQLKRR